MYTFFKLPTSNISPPLKSFTIPASNPAFRLYSSSLCNPYTFPFGNSTRSLSTWLFVWCAYGTFLASPLSSVLQIGQTDVVSEEEEVGDIDVLLLCEEWQAGVLSAERPVDNAMWRSGTEGRESSELWVCMKRVDREVHLDGLYSS